MRGIGFYDTFFLRRAIFPVVHEVAQCTGSRRWSSKGTWPGEQRPRKEGLSCSFSYSIIFPLLSFSHTALFSLFSSHRLVFSSSWGKLSSWVSTQVWASTHPYQWQMKSSAKPPPPETCWWTNGVCLYCTSCTMYIYVPLCHRCLNGMWRGSRHWRPSSAFLVYGNCKKAAETHTWYQLLDKP